MEIKKKPLLLPAIHPNSGIKAQYQADLFTLLRDVRNSALEIILTHWEARNVIANDAIEDWVAHAVDMLLVNWLGRLNDLAEPIAKGFVNRTAGALDRRYQNVLKQKGFTVKFQMTDFTREAFRASIGENVGLIRSIPTEYLGDVSKYVWEAVSAGFDLATLTDNLDHAYHIGRNRCKLIARDQGAKAHAVIERARRQELGIKEAIWRHSGASKKPRQSHVNANGKRYSLAKGMLIDGKYIHPSEEINCGCVSQGIIEV